MVGIGSDVETVLALEAPTKALLAALKAAQPAAQRLSEAGFAGGMELTDAINFGIEGDCAGGVEPLADALRAFRVANGNAAAFDFEWQVKYYGQSVDEAADALIDSGGSDIETLDRVKALRQFAASVA